MVFVAYDITVNDVNYTWRGLTTETTHSWDMDAKKLLFIWFFEC